jgi:hypothetical protein
VITREPVPPVMQVHTPIIHREPVKRSISSSNQKLCVGEDVPGEQPSRHEKRPMTQVSKESVLPGYCGKRPRLAIIDVIE